MSESFIGVDCSPPPSRSIPQRVIALMKPLGRILMNPNETNVSGIPAGSWSTAEESCCGAPGLGDPPALAGISWDPPFWQTLSNISRHLTEIINNKSSKNQVKSNRIKSNQKDESMVRSCGTLFYLPRGIAGWIRPTFSEMKLRWSSTSNQQ